MINISEHAGKMTGIRSISTSTLLNPRCRRLAAIKGSICSHCYADTLCRMRKNLAAALERNTHLLTEHKLSAAEIPVLDDEIFRFEAFGDLNNEQQLENYVTIVRNNPRTRFALYTKAYELVASYFKEHPMPRNMNLIVSSLKLNQPVPLDKWFKMEHFPKGQIKSFTVYTKDYIDAHPELKINCGSRSCNKCRMCYNATTETAVKEILKSDQSAAETIINWRDPVFIKKTAESVQNILDDWRI